MISPLERGEWELLKELRLASLLDSPDALSPTYEENAARPDSYWQEGAKRFGSEPDLALFIVRPRDGLMSATRDEAGIGHIGAMWVTPGVRGRHLGSALLDTGLAFLEGRGCEAIELSVTEGNEPAIRLYESRGFEFTGRWEPLRPGSPLRNLFMRRTLARDA